MIGFLHTSPTHLRRFEQLVKTKLPKAQIIQRVDESLLKQARRPGVDVLLQKNIMAHLVALKDQGATIIICTCSSIGSIVEASALEDCLTLRVDRPMADLAVNYANILVVATLESTLEPTAKLLNDSAQNQGLKPRIDIKLIEGAWAFFIQNHQVRYHQCIAKFILAHADAYDVVVLAQASMAPAIAMCKTCPKPILGSPETMIDQIKICLKGLLHNVIAAICCPTLMSLKAKYRAIVTTMTLN